jgi:uncharacterized protein
MESTYDTTRLLAEVYSDIRKRFVVAKNLPHGWEHVDRVYKLALYLARQEHADAFIVGMAALMHDLGHTAQEQTHIHHADLSVAIASAMLQQYQVPDGQQQAILHAIVAHSFSRGEEPRTLEARVVRDADRLDALGAIGIMRWAMVSEQYSTPQTHTCHPDDPFARQHSLDDKAYALDHFYHKLLRLAETMTTETGVHLAQQRTAFMRNYLQQFEQELVI